jgi:hypothetical protein
MNSRMKQGLHAAGIVAVLVLGLAAGAAANAGGRGHVSIGIGVGGPYWGGGWGYGRWGYGGWGYDGYGGYPYGYGYGYGYGYPGTVVVHQQPIVVAPNATQPATWYYCREAQMYYPYVSSCPSGWQEVPATPPPAANPAPAVTERTAPKPVPQAR